MRYANHSGWPTIAVGIPQAYEETNALLVFITQMFNRGSDGKCTGCREAEGDHHGSFKYCYVSTTSSCPPPHVYGFVLLSYTKTPNCLCVVLILYLVWMCAGGASSCPPYKSFTLLFTKVCFIYLRHTKKLVPNFLFVWHVDLCPTTWIMCSDSSFGLDVRRDWWVDDKSSLHMDLYTKVWLVV